MVKRVVLSPICMSEGKAAWGNGIHTVDGAKLANPYNGFGEQKEHARFVSWNRGWNEAKEKATA